MPGIREMPLHERPRERLAAQGAAALGDAELLALLLSTGTRRESALGLAHLLLAGGDLRRLARASLRELCCSGVGAAKASRVLAAFELGRRATAAPRVVGERVRGPEALARWYLARLRGLRHERLEGVYLDARGRVLAVRTLAQGSLNAALVQPREVFAPALAEGAAALVLVHNHPSGDPAPSEADVEFTKLVAAAGELFGVPLLDHVIVGDAEWKSLRRLGVLRGTRPVEKS